MEKKNETQRNNGKAYQNQIYIGGVVVVVEVVVALGGGVGVVNRVACNRDFTVLNKS